VIRFSLPAEGLIIQINVQDSLREISLINNYRKVSTKENKAVGERKLKCNEF
jgi:hypothetical protein